MQAATDGLVGLKRASGKRSGFIKMKLHHIKVFTGLLGSGASLKVSGLEV